MLASSVPCVVSLPLFVAGHLFGTAYAAAPALGCLAAVWYTLLAGLIANGLALLQARLDQPSI